MCSLIQKILLIRNCRTKQFQENLFAVGISQCRAAGSFGMRHHAKNVSFPVADASDVIEGAIGIGSS